MSLRETILGATKLKRERVEVPEWDGAVLWVRELKASEREDYTGSIVKVDRRGNRELQLKDASINLIILCTCDEQGNPVFTPKDRQALREVSGAGMRRVERVVERLNNLSDEDEKLDDEGLDPETLKN